MTRSAGTAPPRLGEWIVARLVPAHARDAVLGDLHERCAERVRQGGPGRATLWYWRQVLGFVVRAPVTAAGNRVPHLADDLRQDLAFAFRGLARRPGFTSIAVLTLGLGIAASTAMFSVVDAVLLRPLPFPEPGEIVSLYVTNPSLRGHTTLAERAERGPFSFPEFEIVDRGSKEVLEGVAAWDRSTGFLEGDGPPERISMGRATSGLFARVLQVDPILGRTFTAGDREAAVILLTEGLWRSRFASDPAVVGSSLPMGGSRYTVIGVVPDLPGSRFEVEAWWPFRGDQAAGSHGTSVLGRLREGTSESQAAERLTAVLRATQLAGHPHEHSVNAFGLEREETRNARGPLLLLMAAALLLLVVACGNVAALLVGAAASRSRELAVREALGAGGGRLLRQLLVEGTVLASLAAALGVALALAATRALVFLAPADLPRVDEATLDPRALRPAA